MANQGPYRRLANLRTTLNDMSLSCPEHVTNQGIEAELTRLLSAGSTISHQFDRLHDEANQLVQRMTLMREELDGLDSSASNLRGKQAELSSAIETYEDVRFTNTSKNK